MALRSIGYSYKTPRFAFFFCFLLAVPLVSRADDATRPVAVGIDRSDFDDVTRLKSSSTPKVFKFDSSDDLRGWNIIEDEQSQLKSCRRAQNVKIDQKILKLETLGPVSNCKKEYTTGYISSKYNFSFGYYEAKLRIGAASGLNNAFWLAILDNNSKPAFEIDIVEGHFPNNALVSVHDWRGKHKVWNKKIVLKSNASQTSHIFGALWLPGKIVFFIDGQPVARFNIEVTGQAQIRLSTAVMDWAGAVNKDVLHASMGVSWIKVFQ